MIPKRLATGPTLLASDDAEAPVDDGRCGREAGTSWASLGPCRR
jgi:hypothetical protein